MIDDLLFRVVVLSCVTAPRAMVVSSHGSDPVHPGDGHGALVDNAPNLWHQQGLEEMLFGERPPRTDSPYDRILVAVMALIVALGRFWVDVLVVAYYAYSLLPFNEADGIVKGLRSAVMEIRGTLLRFAMYLSMRRRANVTSEQCACQSSWVLAACSGGPVHIECMLCGDPSGGGRELFLLSRDPYFADIELGALARSAASMASPPTVAYQGRQ